MKILVTGFDPFDGEPTNPSIEAVKRLPDTIADAEIVKVTVPTIFVRSAALVRQAILDEQPDVVLSIGQAGGRSAITPELVAINLNDARVTDNAGLQPVDEPIQPDGPTAYFTQLPVKEMVDAMHEVGVPAAVSTTAGTFVCNHLMYQVQYQRAKEFPWLAAGFMHIPYLPSQVIDKPGMPSMALVDVVRGITAAITALVKGINAVDDGSPNE